MERKLATIQVVKEVNPIPDADKIEVVSVLGWKVVVRKGEFKPGDKCAYFEIDSVIPRASWNDFLFKHPEDTKFRLKTVRLRKQLSQGLVVPLSAFVGTPIADWSILVEGHDITEALGIVKYEKPVPANMAGLVKGGFPSYLHKTDEPMMQSILPVINEIAGKEVYITVKCDGTSGTFARFNDEIDVCSRNLSLKEQEGNVFWQMFRKYKMQEVFSAAGNFAIQGEVCGPGIQKNRLGLKEHELFVFNVYDIKAGTYLNFADFKGFCDVYKLQTVPILQVCQFVFCVEDLLKMAKGKYATGKNREGIVIRPTVEAYSPTIDAKYGMAGRMSFKVLNNDYLEKDEE